MFAVNSATDGFAQIMHNHDNPDFQYQTQTQ